MQKFPDKKDQQLIKAFSLLKNEKEIQGFLRDLFTLAELKEASNRFHIATLLWQGGMSYIEIAKECGTSTTTVTRVNEWLFKRGGNGYLNVLKRLYPKS